MNHRRAMTLTGYRGSIEVLPGDRFTWDDGATWEIVRPVGQAMYSPSGIGGTAVVECRHVGGPLSDHMAKYTKDGLCDWCGDSIASNMLWAREKARLTVTATAGGDDGR